MVQEPHFQCFLKRNHSLFSDTSLTPLNLHLFGAHQQPFHDIVVSAERIEVINGLEKATFLNRLLLLALPEDTLPEKDVKFMAGGANSFGDGRYNLTEIAGQMIVGRVVQKLQQLRQQRDCPFL